MIIFDTDKILSLYRNILNYKIKILAFCAKIGVGPKYPIWDNQAPRKVVETVLAASLRQVYGLGDAYSAPGDRSRDLSGPPEHFTLLHRNQQPTGRLVPPEIFTTRFAPRVVRSTSTLFALRSSRRRRRPPEVMRSVTGGAVGVPESINTSGVMVTLSLPVYTAIGGPKTDISAQLQFSHRI